MAKNAASEELMGKLHETVARQLLAELDKDEVDHRTIRNAIIFLNNNKVTMTPFLADSLSEIEQKLRERTQRFSNVKDMAIEAAKKAAAM